MLHTITADNKGIAIDLPTALAVETILTLEEPRVAVDRGEGDGDRRGVPAAGWQRRDAEFRLDYSRRTETDMEVCMPRQRLELLAEGRGHWRAFQGA